MTKKRYKFNVKKFRAFVLSLAVIVTLDVFIVNCFMYPEKYSTTCKKDLNIKTENQDPDALEYYNDTYVSNGIILYEE